MTSGLRGLAVVLLALSSLPLYGAHEMTPLDVR
jgi:hypothetical protein